MRGSRRRQTLMVQMCKLANHRTQFTFLSFQMNCTYIASISEWRMVAKCFVSFYSAQELATEWTFKVLLLTGARIFAFRHSIRTALGSSPAPLDFCLRAVIRRNTIFWDVQPCILAEIYRHLGATNMYVHHNSSSESLDRRPSGTQSLSECRGEEKNLCPCRKSYRYSPIDQSVAYLLILIVLTGCRNVYFFLYGLFNDTFDDFVCRALNDKIISE